MDAKDRMIRELKNQVDKLQTDYAVLKYNYNEEKESNLELSERLVTEKVRMIAQRNDFNDRIDDLQTEVANLKNVQRKVNPNSSAKILERIEK